METSPSLLERLRTSSDHEAWQRFDKLYRPLILRWINRDSSLGAEANDIVQEVMVVLAREAPDFQRRQTGSFRRWLRTVTAYRLAAFYRSRQHRPRPLGAPAEECPLAQLADPNSELSRIWDDEHDRYVLRRLMDLIGPQFEESTLAAFRRTAFDGTPPAEVAADLGISLNAVLLAKSRVLKRLREEAEGLID